MPKKQDDKKTADVEEVDLDAIVVPDELDDHLADLPDEVHFEEFIEKVVKKAKGLEEGEAPKMRKELKDFEDFDEDEFVTIPLDDDFDEEDEEEEDEDGVPTTKKRER
jgi:hypothetical protein